MSYNIFSKEGKQYYVYTSGNVINNGSENVETKISNYYISFIDRTYGRTFINGASEETKSDCKYLLNDNGKLNTTKGK